MDFTLADVFKSSLFTATSLSAAIDHVPYVPSTLSSMGIFEENGVSTTTIAIEQRNNTLQLVPSRPRGAPGTPRQDDKRKAIQFQIPHLPVTDTLTPDQIQNVRGFGTPAMLVGVSEVRDDKIAALSRNLDVTLEYHRLGAIAGKVLDANGDTLIDCYEAFGIDEPDVVSLHLNDVWDEADGGVVRGRITGMVRDARDALDGVMATGWMALCGDAFFDKFVNHPELRQTYINQSAANGLRGSDPLDKVFYGNVTWANYRGWGDVAIDDDQFRLIPLGVPQMFITRFAPAPHFSAVNTKGKDKYVLASLDKTGEKEIEIEAQSNPINLCTRPEALLTGAI